MKEIIISSIKGLGKSGQPQKKKKKMKLNLYYTYTHQKKKKKINSKQIKDLNVCPET